LSDGDYVLKARNRCRMQAQGGATITAERFRKFAPGLVKIRLKPLGNRDSCPEAAILLFPIPKLPSHLAPRFWHQLWDQKWHKGRKIKVIL